MTDSIRIGVLQLNFQVGNFQGNAQKILEGVRSVSSEKIDFFVTPELSLWGYSPKDLLLYPDQINENLEVLKDLAFQLKDLPSVWVGGVSRSTLPGKPLYNTMFLLSEGSISQRFHKKLLPNYDVFEEPRYFQSSEEWSEYHHKGHRIAISICEDIWNHVDVTSPELYADDPLKLLQQRAQQDPYHLILNFSASPFEIGKPSKREKMFSKIALKHGTPLLWVNSIGGNDELIFDGRSSLFSGDGTLLQQAPAFEESISIFDIGVSSSSRPSLLPQKESSDEELWRALVLGTKDYVKKSGFSKVLLGLSGGIDSALTAAIAVEALGAENVLGVLMPSPYTSFESNRDANELAHRLGITTQMIPIEPLMASFEKVLSRSFKGYSQDSTEENIQARIRGTLLMALSNKYQSLLLTTGNKSEIAVGYCTLYGDMCGALAVIGDVYKTEVFQLARWYNQYRNEPIPQSIVEKPPSAELRFDQKDEDSLPPYELLDLLLKGLIEGKKDFWALIGEGFPSDSVRRTVELLERAEFKRKQSAPLLKVSSQSLGIGWKMPLTAARKTLAFNKV